MDNETVLTLDPRPVCVSVRLSWRRPLSSPVVESLALGCLCVCVCVALETNRCRVSHFFSHILENFDDGSFLLLVAAEGLRVQCGCWQNALCMVEISCECLVLLFLSPKSSGVSLMLLFVSFNSTTENNRSTQPRPSWPLPLVHAYTVLVVVEANGKCGLHLLEFERNRKRQQ